MINLTSFILGVCLTSICFLIYLKHKKKTRGRKIIFHALREPIDPKDLATKPYVDGQTEKGEGGKPTSQDDLATPRYVQSQIKKGKGGIYQ